MQFDALMAVEYALMWACAALAYKQGGRGEQLGALWFSLNMAVSAAAYMSGLASPVVQLVEDGIFAIGLLPLAMIFVSHWIGLITFIAAALFSLEALYLLNDRPIDITYVWINNGLWLAVPLVFLCCGVTNYLRNRRAARAEAQLQAAAAAA
ncbi:hypothetical protein LJR219_002943 [Phenylobacterium sp. LjRoot219]|uniref:hypothetical protein n=1 Tax=Phenylobacterium sp. LjRoot219 TaxID=3342283 RepID=UPI003ECCE33A